MDPKGREGEESETEPTSMYHNRSPLQLARYSSAPAGSFLSSLVDSVLAGDTDFTPIFPAEDSSTESAPDHAYVVACTEGDGGSAPPPPPPPPHPQSLVRQQSSPSEFLSHHVMLDTVGSGAGHGHQFLGLGRPTCHLSSRQDSLSSISGLSSTDELRDHLDIHPNHVLPYNNNADLNMPSWDNTHSFGFATPTSKYAKICHDDTIATMDGIDSQLNLPGTPIDVTAMEKLLQMQQDAIPCRVRAKRGCATHPRSIAERLRRTKISQKLKRLQEFVPNMDKQTSTADMLDLAVQYIRVLKSQIQKLKQECDGCTCTRN